MIKQICEMNKCSGCMACINICPQNCIKMSTNMHGEEMPEVDYSKCIRCGLCEKVCPGNTNNEFHSVQHVYVGWSTNEKTRKNSASGGIATEICKYGNERKWYTGVQNDNDNICKYYLVSGEHNAELFSNSKYVYSQMGYIYKDIEEKLNGRHEVVFVGLPCHAAGLKRYLQLKKINMDNLLIVDLICHGVSPTAYLLSWIDKIEQKYHRKAEKIQFRNPLYGTERYAFTLSDKDGEFYHKYVYQMDLYHYGYHHALTYRESCYHCNFSTQKRISDITLGDFSGIGKVQPFNHPKENISCILTNTEKGEALIQEMAQGNAIYLESRPREEAFNYERQLNMPSQSHQNRNRFLKKYELTQSFYVSANNALLVDKLAYCFRKASGYFFFKSIIPTSIKNKFKQIMGHK